MNGAYSEPLRAAMLAARNAGNFLRNSLGSVSAQDVIYKGDIDIVTIYDLEAQRLIVNTLSQVFPDHSFLTEEEQDGQALLPSENRWIIDPLDGTTNYAHGFPHYCVSLALEVSGRVEVGVVFAPVLDEMYTAINGEGAALNGKPIHVSGTSRLIDSLIATGFPYNKQKNLQDCLSLLGRLAPCVRSSRVIGAAALDLCYVASGRLDAYLDVELAPWDMAAGTLIIREAGGFVTDITGAPFNLFGQTVIASNRLLHPILQETLDRSGS